MAKHFGKPEEYRSNRLIIGQEDIVAHHRYREQKHG